MFSDDNRYIVTASVDSGVRVWQSDGTRLALLPGDGPVNSAVFFLLGLYALLTTTHDWPTQSAMLEDYVASTLRSIEKR